ncbi:MAG: hypothetical protein WC360_09580, partial [Opitutales bacterium]
GYACPNADQLINGVKAWWKHAMPEYFRNPRGPSPMPLNLALTWWATQLNKAVNPNDSNIYGVIEGIVSNLGPIRDAGTCTTFAIHNHKSPDKDFALIKQDFKKGSVRYENLIREKDFSRQFANPVSLESFDQMVADKDTGGAEYFFRQVHKQILDTRTNEKTDRITRLNVRLRELQAEMGTLFLQHEIFPNPKPKDTRREHLEKFLGALESIVAEAPALQMQGINLALRHLVNVDFEVLDSVPMDRRRISADHLAMQFQQWINRQAARCAPDGQGVKASDPDWRCLGIDSPDKMREVLGALVKSVLPDMDETVKWLSKLAGYNHNSGDVLDLRRPLAIKMANMICSGRRGSHTCCNPDDLSDPEKVPSADRAHCFYFVEPTIRQMRVIARRDIIPVKRPDQAGDAELVQLCQLYAINPLKAS